MKTFTYLLALSIFSTSLFAQSYVEIENEVVFAPSTTTASKAIRVRPTSTILANSGNSSRLHIDPSHSDPGMLLPWSAVYESYSNFDFDTEVISTDNTVGSLEGGFDVSPLGAAIYQVPIKCPAGINDLSPQISLDYSSDQGRGLLGEGWTLSGYSSISRVGTNHALDGQYFSPNKYVDPVDFDEHDRFAIDGVRLIKSSGTFSANMPYYELDAEYRTIMESWREIVSVGQITTNSPESFEVTTKDGRILRYGQNANSRLMLGNEVFSWYLTEEEDQFGNIIRYEYINDATNNNIRISKISYAYDRVENQFNAEIVFDYARRKDELNYYQSGYNVNLDYLLSGIRIYQFGGLTMQYKLDYLFDQTSKLYKIGLANSKGEEINSTLFKWPECPSITDAMQSTSFNTVGGMDDELIPVDINGDGYTDFVSYDHIVEDAGDCWEFLTKYTHHRHKYVVRAYINRLPAQSGFQKITVKPTFISHRRLQTGHCQYDYHGAFGLQIADFNGDGKKEILIQRYNGNHVFEIFEFDESSSSFNLVDNKVHVMNAQVHSGYVIPALTTGDVNGDGLADVVYDYFGSNGSGNIWHAYFGQSPSSSYIDLTSSPLAFTIDPTIGTFELVDFDNNGADEIFYLRGNGSYKLYTLNYTPTLGRHFVLSKTGSLTNFDSHHYGDLNGDGFLDLILYNATGYNGVVKSYLFDGQDLVSDPNYDFTFTISFWKDRLLVADLQGDGYSDLAMVSYGNGRSSANGGVIFSGDVQFLVSDPESNSFQLAPLLSNQITFDIHYEDYYDNASVADVNGDGVAELFFNRKHSSDQTLALYSEPTFNRFNKIRDGFGNYTFISFKRLNELDNYSITNNNNIYPVFPISPPSSVVDYVVKPGNRQTSFDYEDLYFNIRERNSLGFGQITSLNHVTGIKTIMSSQRLGNYLAVLVPTYNEKKLHSSDLSLATTDKIHNMNVNQFSNGRFTYSLDLQSKTDIDYLQEIKIVESYTYDNYGNKEVVIANHYDESGTGSVLKRTITATNDFETRNSWVDNVLKSSTTLIEQAGQPSYTRSTHYYYNTDDHLSKVTSDQGTGYEVSVEFLNYDVYGHNLSELTSSAGLPNRNVTKTYTSDGLHLSSLSDGSGLLSRYEYDPERGFLSLSENHNGEETRFFYDDWGREFKVLYNDGVSTVSTINWSDPTQHPLGSKTNIHLVKSNGFESIEYQDSRQREMMLKTKGLNGVFMEARTEYNSKWQVFRRSSPIEEGSTPNWTVYTYDDLGRISTEVGDGVNLTYSYQNRTTTLVDNLSGRTSTKENDIFGNLINATDPGGAVSFNYDSRNNLISTTSLSATTNFQYDLHNNRTQIDDPDAGMVQSIYNAYGELETRSDANGKQANLSYDASGRLTQETCNNYTIDISYDPVNKKGSIKDMQMTSGSDVVTYDYTYSAEGNLSSKSVEINGEIWTTNYSYNSLNYLVEKDYPSTLKTQNIYDSNNDLLEVKADIGGVLVSVWTRGSVDEKGRVTDFDLGNGITETLEFNSELGTIDEWQVPGIIDYSYTWDLNTGNLTQKTDNRTGQYEEYTYDPLNRLKDWTTGGLSTLHFVMEYASNGNIREKSDMGNYSYNLPQPHAVDAIETFGTVGTLTQSEDYTDFNKVELIREGLYEAKYTYGPDKQRVKLVVMEEEEPKYQRVYIDGDYQEELDEQTGSLKSYSFIFVQSRPVAVWIEEDGEGQLYYLHCDYQGSIYAISDEFGSVVEYLNYDPWGNRRDPSDWTRNVINGWSPNPNMLLFRGYTFHEHLDEFGIINMNGRIYDPSIGRFYSPDPFVQSPGNTQSYNRFAYAFNNPLRYTDPSGEVIVAKAIWIGAIYGAIAGGTYYAVNTMVNNEDWSWAKFGTSVLGGAISGAFTGMVSHTAVVTSITRTNIANAIAQGMLGAFPFPSVSIPLGGDWSLNLGLGVSTGKASGVGLNTSASYNSEDNPFKFAVGYGFTVYGTAPGSGASTFEQRFSGQIGVVGLDAGILLSTNYFYHGKGNKFNQQVGGLTLSSRIGNAPIVATYENDGYPFVKEGFFTPLSVLADQGDRYRTAAASLKIDHFGIGFNLFTGDPGHDEESRKANVLTDNKEMYPYGYYGGAADDFRLGAVYMMVGNARLGTDSERHRHAIQNKFAHSPGFGRQQPWFKVMNDNVTPYLQYRNNPFTLW